MLASPTTGRPHGVSLWWSWHTYSEFANGYQPCAMVARQAPLRTTHIILQAYQNRPRFLYTI